MHSSFLTLDHNPAAISLQVDFLDWNEYHNKPKKLHRPADVDLVVFVMTNLVYQRGVVVKDVYTSREERIGNSLVFFF